MKARLWSRLPSDIVEQVLSFLPVRGLCRCSAVCKRWNQLITTPAFASLCFRNSKALKRCYIVARSVMAPDDEADDALAGYVGWSILDLAARQWYTFKKRELQHPDDGSAIVEVPTITGFVAADGGLVCEFCDVSDTSMIRVYNPLSRKEGRFVPNPPDHFDACSIGGLMTFVVDEGENSFKIFFIYLGFRHMYPNGVQVFDGPECVTVMHIFESNTQLWRRSTNPPLQPEIGVGFYGSSIMFQGLLYVMFSSYDQAQFWLLSYNVKEDVWKDTNMGFEPDWFSSSPQLIVSDDRLFLVSWVAPNVPSWSHRCCRLRVDEILVADMEPYGLSLKFEMTGELVKLIFHLPKDCMESRPWAWSRVAHGCPGILAFGCGKSIMLFSKKTGISLVYDLELCLWSQMPTNPLEPLPVDSQLWYGMPMNLRLPSVPW